TRPRRARRGAVRARSSRRSPPGRSAARSATRGAGSSFGPLQEGGEGTEPVTLGRERGVSYARGGEEPHQPFALLLRGGREARAQLRVARVDAELPPGLRVDEPELADVGQLLLAGVADLDRHRRVAAREPG